MGVPCIAPRKPSSLLSTQLEGVVIARATEAELVAYFSKFTLADLKTYAWTHMSSATRLTKKADLVAAIVKFTMTKPGYLND